MPKKLSRERFHVGDYALFKERALTSTSGTRDLLRVTEVDPKRPIVMVAQIPGGRTLRVNEALLKRAPQTIVRSYGIR